MYPLLSNSSILFSGVLFFLMLPHAGAAAQGVQEGLQIACSMAIPSLFPFFVLSGLLIRTGAVQKLGIWCAPLMRRLYGLPGASAGPLLLGLIGGYPIGAQAAQELYQSGTLSRAETEELLGFCNNTGPAFLVGVCGAGLCGSVKIGLLLYGIHIVTALFTGLLLPHHTAPYRKTPRQNLPVQISFSESLVAAAEQSGRSCLKITVFIMLFSMLRHVLEAAGVFALAPVLCAPLLWFLGAPTESAAPLLTGLLEMTSGLTLLPETCGRALLPAMSMLIAFGGCSVLCQTAAVMNGLSIRRVLYGKALHGLLAAALTILCQAVFPISISAFSPSCPSPARTPAMGFIFFIYSLFCVIFSGKKHHIPL